MRLFSYITTYQPAERWVVTVSRRTVRRFVSYAGLRWIWLPLHFVVYQSVIGVYIYRATRCHWRYIGRAFTAPQPALWASCSYGLPAMPAYCHDELIATIITAATHDILYIIIASAILSGCYAHTTPLLTTYIIVVVTYAAEPRRYYRHTAMPIQYACHCCRHIRCCRHAFIFWFSRRLRYHTPYAWSWLLSTSAHYITAPLLLGLLLPTLPFSPLFTALYLPHAIHASVCCWSLYRHISGIIVSAEEVYYEGFSRQYARLRIHYAYAIVIIILLQRLSLRIATRITPRFHVIIISHYISLATLFLSAATLPLRLSFSRHYSKVGLSSVTS